MGRLRNWRRYLSLIIPWHFRTTFGNHRGADWEVWWWMWGPRIFATGGRQLTPNDPTLASPCTCHDADGNRTPLHHEYGKRH